jgi:hypothetical protein
MHSDLDILGREAGSSPPSLSSALGVLNPVKYPSFPTLEDSLTLRYPAVKALAVLASLRYIRLAYDGGLHEEER